MNGSIKANLDSLGFRGGYNDSLRSFYLANGATGGSLQDCELQYLISKGYTKGTIQDRWMAYGASSGVYGGYNDVLSALLGKGAIGEAIETFRLNLSNPSGGATLAKSFGTATIQQNPIIPNVVVSRTSGKAPCGIGFDASGTVSTSVSNADRDLFYIWDFGDDVGDFSVYGATPGQNFNVSYGNIAGHVYKTAGTKTWTLTTLDGLGNVQTVAGSVVISAWDESDTIYISNGEVPVAGVNGVTSGASYYNETTWAGVAARFAVNKRVLLNRAHSWACTASTSVVSGLQVGGFGAGVAPTITSSAANQIPFNFNSGPSDVRLQGIKHLGAGEGVGDSGFVHIAGQATTNTLILDCEADASTWGVLTSVPCYETFVQNCNFHNFSITQGLGLPSNIALYVTSGYGLYVIGNNLSDAASHTVRITGAQRFLFDSNRIRKCDVNAVSRDAFTLRGFDNNPVDTFYAGIYTERFVLSNNDCDVRDVPTAQWVFQVCPRATIANSRFRRGVIERNFVATTGEPYHLSNLENVTFRNNIGVSTGTHYASAAVGVSLDNPSIVGSLDPHDCDFYNNTFYMSGSISDYAAIQLTASDSNIRVYNNLAYTPNQTTGVMLRINGATGVIVGNNSTDSQMKTVKPWASSNPTVASDFTPSGSYAVNGGATLPNIQRDFYNSTLTGAREIGAIQV